MDLLKRYEHGEFFNEDSIKQNESQVFKTKGGRTVYGGGGIMPDIFVAQDTTGYSKYYSDVVRKSLVNKFSFRFVDNHRKEFQEFKSAGEIEKYLDSLNKCTKIIFIDEMPWMDGKGSGFVSALEHFWNSWASAQEDLVLIVCGSATSWIINNLLTSKNIRVLAKR